MNNRQNNQLSMFKTLLVVCKENESSWSSVDGFSSAFAEFQASLESLEEKVSTQEEIIKGQTIVKEAAKSNMLELAFKVANGIYAHAVEVEDLDLQEKMDYTASSIAQGKNNAVHRRCKSIYNNGLALTEELPTYGVNGTTMTDFEAAVEAFGNLVRTPRTAIVNRANATKELAKAFKKSQFIVKKKLDSIVNVLKTDDFSFYSKYYGARKVVDLRARGKAEDLVSDDNFKTDDETEDGGAETEAGSLQAEDGGLTEDEPGTSEDEPAPSGENEEGGATD